MEWFDILRGRLRALFQRESILHDIAEEQQIHVEMATEENLARGMSPDEARSAALKSFGNPIRKAELGYDVRGGGWLETLSHDLRDGARALKRSPGVTLIAVITLALGIGANTAIFSVVYAVLLRPLPFADADALVMMWETDPNVRSPVGTYRDFLDWRAESQSFEGMAALSNKRYRKAELTGLSETLDAQGMLISQTLFPLLGLKPVLGRNFLPEEEQPGNNRVVILSESIWRRGFAGERDIVGKNIQLNGTSFVVVGIMGEQYPLDTDFWLPISHLSQVDLNDRRYHSVQVVGRLKRGVTFEQARQEMDALSLRLAQLYPETNKNLGVELMPLRHQLVGNLRPIVLLIFAVVALILLIACANVSNLLLAQASRRQREFAIRAAMGAGRRRIVRQLLVESLLLAFLGGFTALILAGVSLPLLRSDLVGVVTMKIPGLEVIGLDWRALIFTFGVSLFTGVLFGTIPAWQISRVDLNQALKDGGKCFHAFRRGSLSRSLVTFEVALAVIVLVGAGLVVRSFQKLLQVDPGFRADQLLMLKIELPRSRYQKDEQVRNFYQELTARLRALPGVQHVGVIDRLPFAPSLAISRFVAEGQQTEPGKEPITQMRRADYRFFETMGIQLIGGRLLDVRDIADDQVIINQTMAQRFFPNQTPLGRRIFMHFGAGEPTAVTVVGVVSDIKDLGLDAGVEPEIYWPGVGGEGIVLARTEVDPLSLATAMRQAALSTDPSLAVPPAASTEKILDVSLARRRFALNLLSVAAVLALLLASIGIYGVVAASVAQRTQEIGIRLALGAQSGNVLGLMLRHGMKPAAIGIVIGVTGAFWLTRLLRGLLFGIGSSDPLTFTIFPLLLALVALLACYLPARRATKVDPLVVLRSQ